jgi:hypothetical protein
MMDDSAKGGKSIPAYISNSLSPEDTFSGC